MRLLFGETQKEHFGRINIGDFDKWHMCIELHNIIIGGLNVGDFVQ